MNNSLKLGIAGWFVILPVLLVGFTADVFAQLVTNGGFESSDTGVVSVTNGWWFQSGSGINPPAVFEIVSDSLNVEEGLRALEVTVNGTDATAWDIQAVQAKVPVKPGTTYNYSVWVKASQRGAQVNVGVDDLNNNAIIYNSKLFPISSTNWYNITMQFTPNDTLIRATFQFSYAANTGRSIYIDNLQITEVITGPVDSSKIWKGPALAAGQYKFLGNVPNEPPENTFINYWNQLTPGNAGKWGSVAGSAADTSQWNWKVLDAQYNYAIANHLVYKHHNLIWGSQQPSWISSLDSASQYNWIQTWFMMVGQRYPKIDMVDVVNEPLAGHTPPDGQNGHANYIKALGGSGTTGWDWVINAFKLARKYMPATAKLLINDYNIINDTGATTTYLQIINLLKDRGVIDGIADQGHSGQLQPFDTTLLIHNLDRLGATGLPVYISEFDMGNNSDFGTPDDNYQLQQYEKYFPPLWRHPAIKGITLWGYIPPTWVTTAYLVNSDGTYRPAFQWLAQFVMGKQITGVETSAAVLPSHYQLEQNFPNPFNPSTTIQYNIPKTSIVSLKVFDILGREVQTLVNTTQGPGAVLRCVERTEPWQRRVFLSAASWKFF